MSESPSSRCALPFGPSLVCLTLIALAHAACARDNDRRQSTSARASSLISTLPADSMWGPDAPAIKAAMDEQIGQLVSRGQADWALLDSLESPSNGDPSAGDQSFALPTLPVILAYFPPRTAAPSALERATKEYSEGPTMVNGATVESRSKITVWDEGGNLGMMNELRSTATRVTDGVTVRAVNERSERTEVKFCPDAQGVAPGSWEFVEAKEVSQSGTEGTQVDRGEFHATAVLTGQVDDEAELTRVQETMEVKVRESRGSASRNLTPVIGFTTDGSGNRTSTGIDSWEVGEQQNEATSDDTRLGLKAAAILAEISIDAAYEKARERWRRGRCVEVAFLTGNRRRNVAPGERVRIAAEARHKEEGGRLPAPLEASLFAYQSITPEKKRIPPPAEFIYRAPEDGTEGAKSMRDGGTTVRVTSTSRRGIGEGVIEYRLGTGPSYQVQMRVRQEAEKLGTTFDVTYRATLEPGPDGELQGTGSYNGTELSWKVACSDVDQDPNAEEHAVAGKLKATGGAVDMGGKTMLMFSLETLDFPPPAGWSGEVDEEVKGRGTVGNLGLTLTGNSTTKTVKGEGDLMGFSSETECTGKFSNTQETTVQIVE